MQLELTAHRAQVHQAGRKGLTITLHEPDLQEIADFVEEYLEEIIQLLTPEVLQITLDDLRHR